jgi:hypothetical protein
LPPEKLDEPGRAAPLAGPLNDEPDRDDAAVPGPGPPACPVRAARDGEVQVRAELVGAETELLAEPRTDPCPGVAAGGLRYAGVVAATSPLLAVVPVLPVVPVPTLPLPPVGNGYQRMLERLPDEPELVDDVVVRGVGVGPPAGVSSSSSGSVIAVSGFRRKVGSPLAGTSSTSVSPCASFISEARAGVHVWAGEVSRHMKS